MRTTILDHGYLEIIEHWGSDERIVEAARMSTQKGFLGWGDNKAPGDEKLLRYLMQNRHETPFEMAGMVIEVQAPIMALREWQRHRTQCLSGDSLITCVAPRGTSYQRTIKEIFDLKHGGVVDQAPARHRNGSSKAGKPVTRAFRRKHPWRTRILPNCQSRILRVLDEQTQTFTTASMADVWESGVKPIYFVQTLDGRSLRASAEHPFYTQRGWIKLKDLEVGDRIGRIGVVAAQERLIPPALRQGIGVWTSMMRSRLIAEQDRCYLCGERFDRSELVLDHIVPVSLSLLTALDERNLQPACQSCHRQKTNREQPHRQKQTRRGLRWDRLTAKPKLVGEEMTYDLEVAGPNHNYLANELVVHNSFNEMSARYAPLPAVDYLPTAERCLSVNGANKQANAVAGAAELTHDTALAWLEKLAAYYAQGEALYQEGLSAGVPKELARLPLTVGRFSRMRASANLRNWLAFLTLRSDVLPSGKAAQWEIRQYANAVAAAIAERFPRTYELFVSRS